MQVEEEARKLREQDEEAEKQKLQEEMENIQEEEPEDNAPIIMPFDVFIPRAEFFFDRDRYFFESLIQVSLHHN